MRKLILLFALMLSVVFVNAQNTLATFNLSMTVDEYIEVTPGPLDWDIGLTIHSDLRPTELIYDIKEWDLAYANCGFNITIDGSNDAGQDKPRFARQQDGANGKGDWDILPTFYDIHIITNSVSNHVDGGGPIEQQAGYFPLGEDFTETPHNGQVKMSMKVYVNTALLTDPGAAPMLTLIDPSFTDSQSADAGKYECNMLVTLTAL